MGRAVKSKVIYECMRCPWRGRRLLSDDVMKPCIPCPWCGSKEMVVLPQKRTKGTVRGMIRDYDEGVAFVWRERS